MFLLALFTILLTMVGCGVQNMGDPAASASKSDAPLHFFPIPEGIEDTFAISDRFHDEDTCFLITEKQPRRISGVQVHGSSDGTVLEGTLRCLKDDERSWRSAECEIRLRLADGSEASTIVYTDLPAEESFWPGFSLQCIDLEGDGTDEILLFYEYWNTSMWGDLHIFRIEKNGLKEIGAILTNPGNDIAERYEAVRFRELASCAGAEPIYTSDGVLLRIYTNKHFSGSDYGEYQYRNGAWKLVRPVDREQVHNPMQDALERWDIYDFSKLNEFALYDLRFTERVTDYAMDLSDTGVNKDRLYIYHASIAELDEEIVLLEWEHNYGSGNRGLLACFQGPETKLQKVKINTDKGMQEIQIYVLRNGGSEVHTWRVDEIGT